MSTRQASVAGCGIQEGMRTPVWVWTASSMGGMLVQEVTEGTHRVALAARDVDLRVQALDGLRGLLGHVDKEIPLQPQKELDELRLGGVHEPLGLRLRLGQDGQGLLLGLVQVYISLQLCRCRASLGHIGQGLGLDGGLRELGRSQELQLLHRVQLVELGLQNGLTVHGGYLGLLLAHGLLLFALQFHQPQLVVGTLDLLLTDVGGVDAGRLGRRFTVRRGSADVPTFLGLGNLNAGIVSCTGDGLHLEGCEVFVLLAGHVAHRSSGRKLLRHWLITLTFDAAVYCRSQCGTTNTFPRGNPCARQVASLADHVNF